MSTLLSIAFLVQIVRISVPYVLASQGGVFSERSGVVNIALEGLMLTGAFSFVLGVHLLGSPWLGLLTGLVGAGAMAALFGLVTIRFRADQIVAGVAVNLLAVGATKFALKLVWDSSSNSSRVEAIEPLVKSGPMAQLVTHPLVLLTVAVVLAAHVVLYRTRFGLRLRACGEHPAAAQTLGIRVTAMRWAGVLLSGLLAGLAGVWLASEQHQFTDNMTNGRGYIALAAMIVGKWDPRAAALACLTFGAAEALQMTLQGAGSPIPGQLLQTLPYLLTIVTVVGFMGRARPPAAVGKPLESN